MCSAPFRLIDNWNSVYVLQGYHYFSQRIFFSSCSWPPIAPIPGFPPSIPVAVLARFAPHSLAISCSSARLTLVAVVPALGTIIQKQFPESKYTPESKHVSEFGVWEAFGPCFGFWKVLAYEPLDCVFCFCSELVRGVHVRASVK